MTGEETAAFTTEISHRIADAADRLAEEFRDRFDAGTVQRYVQDSRESYRESRIADFVPLLVYRFTRERLLDIARENRGPGPA